MTTLDPRTTGYRRRLNSDVWHSNQRCRWWPSNYYTQYKMQLKKPASGEFCNECQAKTRRENRQPVYDPTLDKETP